eukprot:UN34908
MPLCRSRDTIILLFFVNKHIRFDSFFPNKYDSTPISTSKNGANQCSCQVCIRRSKPYLACFSFHIGQRRSPFIQNGQNTTVLFTVPVRDTSSRILGNVSGNISVAFIMSAVS